MTTKSKTGPYKVGYKSPPLHSQFPPGVSGCQTGRPRRAAGKTTLEKLAAEKVRVNVGGVSRLMTKEALLLSKCFNDAINGDIRARRIIIPELNKLHRREAAEPEQIQMAPIIFQAVAAKPRQLPDHATPSSDVDEDTLAFKTPREA